MDIDISFTVCRMLLILVVIHHFFIVQYTGTVYRFNFWVNWGICPNLCSICTLIWLQRTNFPSVQKVSFLSVALLFTPPITHVYGPSLPGKITLCANHGGNIASVQLQIVLWYLASANVVTCPVAARKYAALAIINIVCLLAAAPPGGSCCNQRLLPFFKIQPSQRAATICN